MRQKLKKIAALNNDYGLDLDQKILTPGGEISWPQLANKLIMNEFDTDTERSAIDGVVAHVYSTTPKNINSRFFDFNTISKTWTPEFDDLTTYSHGMELKKQHQRVRQNQRLWPQAST